LRDLSADWSVTYEACFLELLVQVPYRNVSHRLWESRPMRPAKLSGPGATALSHMLQSAADELDRFTPQALAGLEMALIELLSIIPSDPTTVPIDRTRTQELHLQRIFKAIDRRLNDPRLSLTVIAEEEAMTPRYVQKLVETKGTNFTEYVRSRRLERCSQDLANPDLLRVSITEISFRWGFNDSAHFSRAFKDRFGVSPRDFRRRLPATVGVKLNRGCPRTAWRPHERDATSVEHVDGLFQAPAPRQARAAAGGETPRGFLADDGVATHPTLRRFDRKSPGPKTKIPADVSSGRHHYLPANKNTVHWGYFSRAIRPALTIDSGDLVTIEGVTHHAYDDYERMVDGDPALEAIFRWTKTDKGVDRRGAGPLDASIFGRGSGEGFGVHLCTGPVFVRDAEPGDVLEIRVIDVKPRPSANPRHHGKAFGSNASAWWGFQYQDLLEEPRPREVVTIYEIDVVNDGGVAKAVYSYQWVPQLDPFGILHPTIDYPGVPVDHSTIKKQFGLLEGARVPLRPHFGVMAVAPKEATIVDSIPPGYFGGNLDNWRIGRGASLFLPVAVPGALFSAGDPHASQGDAEVAGTAIECSMTGLFQLILHKRSSNRPAFLRDLDYPLVDTGEEWVVQGFSYANYLSALGGKAQSEIYNKSSIDLAMRDAFRKIRRLLMTTYGLSEDEAISLISVAVDFGVTQVVDGNWGVHATMKKSIFQS
jgi:acetamidase/formamidase/AraC-like DNA-binding protein